MPNQTEERNATNQQPKPKPEPTTPPPTKSNEQTMFNPDSGTDEPGEDEDRP